MGRIYTSPFISAAARADLDSYDPLLFVQRLCSVPPPVPPSAQVGINLSMLLRLFSYWVVLHPTLLLKYV